jgi:enoyl-CoA hydratase/carnithine racemase
MLSPPPLPESYTHLSFKQIQLSHVPASCPSPTPVILITLNRPSKNNAYTNFMGTELEYAIGLLSHDPRVRTLVVTGAGKMFCAGADLEAETPFRPADETTTPRNFRDGGGMLALTIHRCPKPIVAAINGHAVGLGVTITLPMAIRVVSEKAKLGLVFARRGIVMESASSYFLPRLIGLSRAMHLVTTGAVYPATHPLWGELFSEIVPPEKVLPRALALADEIARNTSVVSTSLMKDMMWRGPESPEQAHLLESKLLLSLFDGKDQTEGVESFLQKRPANFQGNMRNDAPAAWPWWDSININPAADEPKSKL